MTEKGAPPKEISMECGLSESIDGAEGDIKYNGMDDNNKSNGYTSKKGWDAKKKTYDGKPREVKEMRSLYG